MNSTLPLSAITHTPDPGMVVLVSVIIPTRNRCELLLRAIASVQRQTHSNWQLIVVDDGSTDDTVQRLSNLCLLDPRIVLLKNSAHRGGSYCRHKGATHSNGEFVAFLDSDDYWLPHKLARQLSVAQSAVAQDVVVVSPMAIEKHGQAKVVIQAHLQPAQSIAEYLYCGGGAALQASSILVSGALARRVKFDPELPVNQDTDYLLRLEQVGAEFIYVAEALHVQDVTPRADRITMRPELIEHSLAWFARVSAQWPETIRRGFYLSDTSIRVARAGDRMLALRYFFRGLSWSTGIYPAIRQLVRVLNGGEIPQPFSKLMMLLHRLSQPSVASNRIMALVGWAVC